MKQSCLVSWAQFFLPRDVCGNETFFTCIYLIFISGKDQSQMFGWFKDGHFIWRCEGVCGFNTLRYLQYLYVLYIPSLGKCSHHLNEIASFTYII